MALCTVCSAVPFRNLPEPSKPSSGFIQIADQNDLPELWFDKEEARKEDFVLGYPWHESLDTLAASAKTCALCGFVQKGAEEWINHYESATKDNQLFKEFHADRSSIPHGQKLWLTKRFGEGPGFIVLIQNKDRPHGVILLTGVSFVVEAGDPLAHTIPLRPMHPDSNSPQSLHLAKSWLNNCVANHVKCVEKETTLPSRILDISSSDDVITLVETNGISGKYASLSYCWGSGPHFTTHSQSIEARKSGFPLAELPQTLRDAVVIARHMGLKWLWIDSLCICQDDAEDWARESARMISVYSNAHVVIAANHADNSSVGCFHSRPIRPHTTLTLPGLSGDGQKQATVQATLLLPGDENGFRPIEFEDEPLSTRGWGLQERVLARRVLHYNSQKMYFECECGMTGEDGHHTKWRLSSLQKSEDHELKKTDHEMWNGLLWSYGKRKLSKPTDKLPAMSGLAKEFEQRLGAKYVAGLWSDDLIEGLAWQGLGSKISLSKKHGEYLGPSWSFANYDGICATGVRNRGFNDIAKIEDWGVELKTAANPYGEVKDAWIRLKAPLAKVTPSTLETNEHEIRLRRAGRKPLPRMCTVYSDDENGKIVTLDHRDEDDDSEEWRQWDLEVLMLGGYPKSKDEKPDEKQGSNETDDGIDFCYCMVVRKLNDGKDAKRRERVGWTFMDAEPSKKMREDEKTWTEVVLV